MPIVNYSDLIDRPYLPGMIVSTDNAQIWSAINGSDTQILPFGLAVVRSEQARQIKVPVQSSKLEIPISEVFLPGSPGAVTGPAEIEGITFHSDIYEIRPGYTRDPVTQRLGFQPKGVVSLIRRGVVAVLCETGTNRGSDVFVRMTPTATATQGGAFRASPDGTNTQFMPNATFLSTIPDPPTGQLTVALLEIRSIDSITTPTPSPTPTPAAFTGQSPGLAPQPSQPSSTEPPPPVRGARPDSGSSGSGTGGSGSDEGAASGESGSGSDPEGSTGGGGSSGSDPEGSTGGGGSTSPTPTPTPTPTPPVSGTGGSGGSATPPGAGSGGNPTTTPTPTPTPPVSGTGGSGGSGTPPVTGGGSGSGSTTTTPTPTPSPTNPEPADQTPPNATSSVPDEAPAVYIPPSPYDTSRRP